MSTITPTAEHYVMPEPDMHPSWCALGSRCDESHDSIRVHAGHVAQWRPEPDDGHLTLNLIHHEDIVGDRDHGRTELRLEVVDACGDRAEVTMTPEDVAMLRRQLARFEQDLQGEQYWTTRRGLEVNDPRASMVRRAQDGKVTHLGVRKAWAMQQGA